MPAIFELLYKEFCRARLAEMRKQLLLTGKHPKIFLPEDDPAESGWDGPAATRSRIEARAGIITSRQQYFRKAVLFQEATLNTPEVYAASIACLSCLTIVVMMAVGAW